tara:strand:- start:896 stop:1393 length:498 start_codon:yes stop_codon:yes gene_type:complete
MNYLKISLGIFIALAASRFIPHPPNFTSLLALSFYVPAFFGRKYIPALILSFAITDIFLGFHNTLIFTWGSVFVIGFISNLFKISLIKRIIGVVIGVLLFYLITNFGVWISGDMYEKNLNGLLLSYNLAVPFLLNSLVSTLIFSMVIEGLLKIYGTKKIKINFFK